MKTSASTSAPARLGVVWALLLFGPAGLLRAQPNPPAARVDFVRDIQSLLERSCIGGHGPVKPKSGHRVDTRDAIIKGGESQDVAIVPGHSEKSLLVHFISGLVPDMEMPPLDKQDMYPALSPGEIALVRVWIDQGASWPEGVQLRVQPPRPLQAGPVAGPVARAQREIYAHFRRGDAPAIAAALQDRSVLESRDEAGNTPPDLWRPSSGIRPPSVQHFSVSEIQRFRPRFFATTSAVGHAARSFPIANPPRPIPLRSGATHRQG